MKSFVLVLGLLALLGLGASAILPPRQPPLAASPIKHVVALMFENRAFDHMLGFLKKFNPEINGLTGNEYNLVDPSNSNSEKVFVSFDAPDDMNWNPGHGITNTISQMSPCSPGGSCGQPMGGFVMDGIKIAKNASRAKTVMKGFNTSSLPVLSQLALDYAIFDTWFSSVPGPTEPNRMYALSGTSYGMCFNDVPELIMGMPQRAITDDLLDAGLDWHVYFGDFPTALILNSIRRYPSKVSPMEIFRMDAAKGRLPAFSWIEPRYFTLLDWKMNDQHPATRSDFQDGSVSNGELLLADVYKTLINSPNWNETLLLVYYDEHGGLYDHVPPPTGVPNPDGRNCTNPINFPFDRLGVRIPAVAISPWVKKGSVVRPPTGTTFDHTSLLGTMRKMFNLRPQPLTKREEWSGTFEHIFLNRAEPRTDFIKNPLTPELQSKFETYMKNEAKTPRLENILSRPADLLKDTNHNKEISDLQSNLAYMATLLAGDRQVEFVERASKLTREQDGALFVRELMEAYRAGGDTKSN